MKQNNDRACSQNTGGIKHGQAVSNNSKSKKKPRKEGARPTVMISHFFLSRFLCGPIIAASVNDHNKPNPAKTRKSNDGRDRSQAQVVDTYPADNTQADRAAEQQQIDQNGGVPNLDNKRNEIAPKKQPQD